MKRIAILILVSLAMLPAGAWSSKGHQIIAYMAKKHLSAETADVVNDILDGSSIVYYASWLDIVRDDQEYSFTSDWHFINVDPGEDYEHRQSLSTTDAVKAIYSQIEVLRDRTASKWDHDLAVKAIVHCVGDLHQPMHCGHHIDYGGNTVRIRYLGESTNLHSIWDYNLVASAHPWGYYDWVNYLDVLSTSEQNAITEGTLDDWARESVALAAEVYKAFPAGNNVTQTKIDEWTPVVEKQLQRGGLRLASLLNYACENRTDGVTSVCVYNEETPIMVYTIQGVPLNSPIEDLPKGFYITSDRRKILVR